MIFFVVFFAYLVEVIIPVFVEFADPVVNELVFVARPDDEIPPPIRIWRQYVNPSRPEIHVAICRYKIVLHLSIWGGQGSRTN